ncbi:MAG: alpha-amylase family glycosyl hydrolase [Cyclobacteriaceae bacterium]|jgi:glycosidase|nr:alpha-amylase family glycosyl hydrolase [Cyclobacteriaceae bacterium]
MKKHLSTAFFVFVLALFAQAQLVTLLPCQSPSPEQEVTIIFDATGTPLQGETKVYAHAGVVITNTNSPTGSDWTAVKGTWGTDNGVGLMTAVPGEPNKWSLVLSPTLRAYFNTLQPPNAPIYWLAMVFRNANGSKQTSPDTFIRLNQPISLTQPQVKEIFIASGNSFPIAASLCSAATSLKISVDEGSGYVDIGSPVSNATSISVTFTPSGSGLKKVRVTANFSGTEQVLDEILNVFVQPAITPAEPLPAGVRKGINYSSDATKVTLVLETPLPKDFVYVAGDFNNWQADDAYFMKKTPDGKFFWLTISGLTPSKEYVFQYWVDGIIKIGDPYAEKVADPWNDKFIPVTTYPNLPEYTRTDYGVASVLQTAQTPYVWSSSEATWKSPKKEELVVYELLLRDFIGTRKYRDLADSLSYLKRLGINAIELMPIMEFEGNLSWGYNPSYFLAPDKFYGTRNDFKYLVDKAHQEGIAIILDIALNHAFGQCPLVRLYSSNNQPTADNPWFNVVAKHPFNVGYDFNHESVYTQAFADSVIRYWIEEYHIDGYRFDLSKGFTQRFSSSVEAWSAYDQSRIDIWDRITKKIWGYKPDAIVILEHFGGESEENVLASKGMLLWRRLDWEFAELLKGNTSTVIRGADRKDLVTFMESHDEERLAFKLKTEGQTSGDYNVRDLPTLLNRVKLGSAFFYTLPGPKMLWQFQELGYDISINTCTNGTISPDCRLVERPLPWGTGSLDYYTNPDRQRLYKAQAAIFKLINSNRAVFSNGNVNWQNTGETRRINITHPSMDVTIIGNFALIPKTINPNFSKTGTWYDYFSGLSIEVTNTTRELTLGPGVFYIYTTVKQPTPEPELVVGVEETGMNENAVSVYPNPASQLLKIELSESASGPVSVSLMTLSGKQLMTERYNGSSEIWLTTENLPAGFYVIEVNTTRGKAIKKVLITR